MSVRTEPSVSVLVTVYNREDYLGPCLESVLASTWRDFELVVVDDASTDGSADIARQIADGDDRVRFARNEANLGDYGNRARAAELARGRFLKYLDSDDIIYPHSLAIMVEAMQAHPRAALGITQGSAEAPQPYPWVLDPEQAWREQFLGRGCLGSGPSGAILRRDAFFDVGGFRDWGVLNDMDLWYRLSARWPVVLLPPALIWWRRHEGQEFARGDAGRVYLERGHALVQSALTSPTCPLTEEERRTALARAKHRHARRLLSLALYRRRPRLAGEMFRASNLGLLDLARGFGSYD